MSSSGSESEGAPSSNGSKRRKRSKRSSKAIKNGVSSITNGISSLFTVLTPVDIGGPLLSIQYISALTAITLSVVDYTRSRSKLVMGSIIASIISLFISIVHQIFRGRERELIEDMTKAIPLIVEDVTEGGYTASNSSMASTPSLQPLPHTGPGSLASFNSTASVTPVSTSSYGTTSATSSSAASTPRSLDHANMQTQADEEYEHSFGWVWQNLVRGMIGIAMYIFDIVIGASRPSVLGIVDAWRKGTALFPVEMSLREIWSALWNEKDNSPYNKQRRKMDEYRNQFLKFIELPMHKICDDPQYLPKLKSALRSFSTWYTGMLQPDKQTYAHVHHLYQLALIKVSSYESSDITSLGRQEPFVILFSGTGNLGKTRLARHLSRKICSDILKKSSRTAYCEINPTDKYWPPLNGQEVAFFDEIGSRKDLDKDLLLGNLRAICSPGFFNAAGADIPHKINPIHFKIITASTNLTFDEIGAAISANYNASSVPSYFRRIVMLDCEWNVQYGAFDVNNSEMNNYQPDFTHLHLNLHEWRQGKAHKIKEVSYEELWTRIEAKFRLFEKQFMDEMAELAKDPRLIEESAYYKSFVQYAGQLETQWQMSQVLHEYEPQLTSQYHESTMAEMTLQSLNVLKQRTVKEAQKFLASLKIREDENTPRVHYSVAIQGRVGQGKSTLAVTEGKKLATALCFPFRVLKSFAELKAFKSADKHVVVLDDIFRKTMTNEEENILMDFYNSQLANHSLIISTTNVTPRYTLPRWSKVGICPQRKLNVKNEGLARRLGYGGYFGGVSLPCTGMEFYVESFRYYVVETTLDFPFIEFLKQKTWLLFFLALIMESVCGSLYLLQFYNYVAWPPLILYTYFCLRWCKFDHKEISDVQFGEVTFTRYLAFREAQLGFSVSHESFIPYREDYNMEVYCEDINEFMRGEPAAVNKHIYLDYNLYGRSTQTWKIFVVPEVAREMARDLDKYKLQSYDLTVDGVVGLVKRYSEAFRMKGIRPKMYANFATLGVFDFRDTHLSVGVPEASNMDRPQLYVIPGEVGAYYMNRRFPVATIYNFNVLDYLKWGMSLHQARVFQDFVQSSRFTLNPYVQRELTRIYKEEQQRIAALWMKEAEEKFKNFVTHPLGILCGIVVTAASGYALYRVCTSDNDDKVLERKRGRKGMPVARNYDSDAGATKKKTHTLEDVKTLSDVNDFTALKPYFEAAHTKCRNNLCQIYTSPSTEDFLEKEPKRIGCYGLFINDQTLVTVGHILGGIGSDSVYFGIDHIPGFHRLDLLVKENGGDDGKLNRDLSVWRTKKRMPEIKDISQMFLSRTLYKDNDMWNAVIQRFAPNKVEQFFSSTFEFHTGPEHFPDNPDLCDFGHLIYGVFGVKLTDFGDCGLPYFFAENHPALANKIIGIHCMGNEVGCQTSGIAAVITQQDCRKWITMKEPAIPLQTMESQAKMLPKTGFYSPGGMIVGDIRLLPFKLFSDSKKAPFEEIGVNILGREIHEVAPVNVPPLVMARNLAYRRNVECQTGVLIEINYVLTKTGYLIPYTHLERYNSLVTGGYSICTILAYQHAVESIVVVNISKDNLGKDIKFWDKWLSNPHDNQIESSRNEAWTALKFRLAKNEHPPGNDNFTRDIIQIMSTVPKPGKPNDHLAPGACPLDVKVAYEPVAVDTVQRMTHNTYTYTEFDDALLLVSKECVEKDTLITQDIVDEISDGVKILEKYDNLGYFFKNLGKHGTSLKHIHSHVVLDKSKFTIDDAIPEFLPGGVCSNIRELVARLSEVRRKEKICSVSIFVKVYGKQLYWAMYPYTKDHFGVEESWIFRENTFKPQTALTGFAFGSDKVSGIGLSTCLVGGGIKTLGILSSDIKWSVNEGMFTHSKNEFVKLDGATATRPKDLVIVTSNPVKINNFKDWLAPNILEVATFNDTDLPEIQGPPLAVALEKLRVAYQKIGKPVLIDDTSLMIYNQGEQPGTNVKWVLHNSGSTKIAIMTHALGSDHRCRALSVCGYKDEKQELLFVGVMDGEIMMPKENSFESWKGIIWLPTRKKCYIDMPPDERKEVSHRASAINKINSFFAKALAGVAPSQGSSIAINRQQYFMNLAYIVASFSPDNNTKVGCVVTDGDNLLGAEFNGPPNTLANIPLEKDPVITSDRKEYYVTCAESKVLARLGERAKGSTIFTTLWPCHRCAQIIVTLGVKKMYYAEDSKAMQDSVKASKKILDTIEIERLLIKTALIPVLRESRVQSDCCEYSGNIRIRPDDYPKCPGHENVWHDAHESTWGTFYEEYQFYLEQNPKFVGVIVKNSGRLYGTIRHSHTQFLPHQQLVNFSCKAWESVDVASLNLLEPYTEDLYTIALPRHEKGLRKYFNKFMIFGHDFRVRMERHRLDDAYSLKIQIILPFSFPPTAPQVIQTQNMEFVEFQTQFGKNHYVPVQLYAHLHHAKLLMERGHQEDVPFKKVEDNETVEVIGVFTNSKSHVPKNCYKKTLFSDRVKDLIPVEKMPVEYNIDKIPEEYLKKISLNNYGIPCQRSHLSLFWAHKQFGNTIALQEVTDMFYSKVIKHYSNLRLLTDKEVLAGAEGLESKYLKGLELDTSIGFTLKELFVVSKKRDVIALSENGKYSWIDSPAGNFAHKLYKGAQELARQGKKFGACYTELLKMEQLKISGGKMYRGRTFVAEDLIGILMQRYVLGDFCIRAMRDDPNCGIGTDPLKHFHRYRLRFAKMKYIWAGDYTNFDRNTPAFVMLELLKLLKQINPKISNELESVFRTLIERICISGTTLFECNGGMPSGCFVTAALNSLNNEYLMFAAYVLIARKKGVPYSWQLYEKNIERLYYGDDVFIGVSEEYATLFTREEVAIILREHFGMILDSSAKDGSSSTFDTWKTASWISRFFRKLDNYPIYVGALKKISIGAYFHYVTDITPEHIGSLLTTAQLEGSVWDEEYFTKLQEAIRIAIELMPSLSRYVTIVKRNILQEEIYNEAVCYATPMKAEITVLKDKKSNDIRVSQVQPWEKGLISIFSHLRDSGDGVVRPIPLTENESDTVITKTENFWADITQFRPEYSAKILCVQRGDIELRYNMSGTFMAILNQAHQSGKISKPEYTSNKTGPDHTPIWQAIVTFRGLRGTINGLVITGAGRGTTKSEAREGAASKAADMLAEKSVAGIQEMRAHLRTQSSLESLRSTVFRTQSGVPQAPMKAVDATVVADAGLFSNTMAPVAPRLYNNLAIALDNPAGSGAPFDKKIACYNIYHRWSEKNVNISEAMTHGTCILKLSLDPTTWPAYIREYVEFHESIIPALDVVVAIAGASGSIGWIATGWVRDASKDEYDLDELQMISMEETNMNGTQIYNIILTDTRRLGLYRKVKNDTEPYPGVVMVVDCPVTNVQRNDAVTYPLRVQARLHKTCLLMEPFVRNSGPGPSPTPKETLNISSYLAGSTDLIVGESSLTLYTGETQDFPDLGYVTTDFTATIHPDNIAFVAYTKDQIATHPDGPCIPAYYTVGSTPRQQEWKAALSHDIEEYSQLPNYVFLAFGKVPRLEGCYDDIPNLHGTIYSVGGKVKLCGIVFDMDLLYAYPAGCYIRLNMAGVQTPIENGNVVWLMRYVDEDTESKVGWSFNPPVCAKSMSQKKIKGLIGTTWKNCLNEVAESHDYYSTYKIVPYNTIPFGGFDLSKPPTQIQPFWKTYVQQSNQASTLSLPIGCKVLYFARGNTSCAAGAKGPFGPIVAPGSLAVYKQAALICKILKATMIKGDMYVNGQSIGEVGYYNQIGQNEIGYFFCKTNNSRMVLPRVQDTISMKNIVRLTLAEGLQPINLTNFYQWQTHTFDPSIFRTQAGIAGGLLSGLGQGLNDYAQFQYKTDLQKQLIESNMNIAIMNNVAIAERQQAAWDRKLQLEGLSSASTSFGAPIGPQEESQLNTRPYANMSNFVYSHTFAPSGISTSDGQSEGTGNPLLDAIQNQGARSLIEENTSLAHSQPDADTNQPNPDTTTQSLTTTTQQ